MNKLLYKYIIWYIIYKSLWKIILNYQSYTYKYNFIYYSLATFSFTWVSLSIQQGQKSAESVKNWTRTNFNMIPNWLWQRLRERERERDKEERQTEREREIAAQEEWDGSEREQEVGERKCWRSYSRCVETVSGAELSFRETQPKYSYCNICQCRHNVLF